MNYSKYSGSSILDLYHLMLRILHQIHIFYNSRPGSPSQGLYIFNCIIKTKLSRCTPIKLVYHWPVRLWFLPSSQYLDYLMRKLTSFTRRGSQLHSTGFSNSSPIVLLKSSKSHALTIKQFADKFDNLSCIYINEWEYIFQVTYVVRRLFT